jgi:3'(2'), 5'-bisphosphate nucleotidase
MHMSVCFRVRDRARRRATQPACMRLVQVSEGLAHVYPRLAPTCEWDTAAAHIIVTEAGGTVVQAGLCDSKGQPLEDWQAALAKGQPVVYNKENILNPFFVVYGKRNVAPTLAGTSA